MKKNELIYRLIQAGFEGDTKIVYRLSLRATQLLSKEDDQYLEKVLDLVTGYSIGKSSVRSLGIEDVPMDSDGRSKLLDVNLEPQNVNLVYKDSVWLEINSFIRERQFTKDLISKGVTPPASILLHGDPGTGKTKLAEYIAFTLGKPLFVLDLATSISSYLGKTGQNLKSVLEYAQESGAVLLLDEFDSIAKKRDDPSDLGELKRIVNVLLKELESWSHNSVLVAATNHPELLDVAIWRRFDVNVRVPMPDFKERYMLFESLVDKSIDCSVLKALATFSHGLSSALIENLSNSAKRRSIVYQENEKDILIKSLASYGLKNIKDKSSTYKLIKKLLPRMSQKKLADILDIAPSTLSYH